MSRWRIDEGVPAAHEGTGASSHPSIAEHFGVDATPVRLLWVILSILCGAGIGGVIVYVVAWLIIPRPQDAILATSAPASPPA